MSQRHRLLFSCPDQPGIVAKIATALQDQGCNIVSAEQHSSEEGQFFLRFVFTGPAKGLQQKIRAFFPDCFCQIQDEGKKRVAVLVSRETHCLADLLWRERSGQLPIEITMVASNHPEAQRECGDTSFFHVPQGEDRQAGEDALLRVLPDDLDFIILARYMRILSADFIERSGVPIINIHHSFLPAFPGARPYRQAYERGVKIIGATAHFVVPELDAGPIIAQGITPVSHRQSERDLRQLGQNEERLVLAQAVQAMAEDRVLLHDERTIVFS